MVSALPNGTVKRLQREIKDIREKEQTDSIFIECDEEDIRVFKA